MIRFAVRRTTNGIVVLLGILFFINLGMGLTSGAPSASSDFDAIREISTAWARSQGVVGRLLSGEFGTVETQVGTLPLKLALRTGLISSLGLVATSLIIASILGLLVGISAALVKNRMFVGSTLALSLIGISTPSFVAAVLAQQGELFYLETTGRSLVSMAGFGWDFQHMFLPILVLVSRPLAYISRSSYLGLSAILREDFIRTAHSKGLSESRILFVHALRNFGIPTLTTLGISIRFIVATLPVAEYMFAWPGVGFHLIYAISAHQTLFVTVLGLMLGSIFLITDFILQIAYHMIDPRLAMS
jgi:peptide/nickel transport system permease protein